ncbi:MAG: hypothetical protein RR441_03435 [Longicatena sp.]
MNNLYDVLQKKQDAMNGQDMIPKEEFAQQMKEKREELNQMVDVELDKIKSDPQAYLNYLDKQALFDQYTVSNTLLIIAQKPDATLIKASDKWRDDKCYIRKGEKGFNILEPKDDYIKEDGSTGKNYKMKSMFDITQLQKPPVIPEKEALKVDELVGALSYKTPVKIAVVDTNMNGQAVFYSMETQQINVAKNLQPKMLLTGLATECCFAELDPHSEKFTREDLSFPAMSSAYMLCKKYGIETPSTEFAQQVNVYFKDLDNKELKSYLSNFKDTFDDVSKRMENGLYAQSMNKQKEHNNVER